MTNQTIPDEAVEAALYAWGFSAQTRDERRELLVTILEAAAPHLMSPREKRFDVPTDPDDGLLEWALGDAK